MFDGKQFRLLETDYIVPALSLRSLRQFAEDGTLKRLGSALTTNPTVEQVDAAIAIAHAAITRNYPTITKDFLLEVLDLANLKPMMDHVFAMSGLEATKPGEAASP